MSTEHDANRNVGGRNEITLQTMKTDGSNDDDDTFEDLAGSADNSIIGKVKSRVSSIIPSRFSKWFSPSTRNNDSLNGSFTVGTARRRRRLESDDDDEYVDDGNINEDGAHSLGGYKENSTSDKVNKDSDEDESDNNSEDGSPKDPNLSTLRTHRSNRSSGFFNQPPSKRSRISYDSSNVNQQSLIASTPAVGVCRRNINSHSTSLVEDAISKPPNSSSYFLEPNTYNQKNVDEPVTYGFISGQVTDGKPQENYANRKISNEKHLDNIAISARRTLHLPSTSQASKDRALSMDFSTFQRQSVVGNRDINNLSVEHPSMSASATIIEEEVYERDEEEALFSQERNLQLDEKSRFNLNGNTKPFTCSKKQKFNGTDDAEGSNADADSVSESSEGCIGNISELPNNINVGQRKTGLFNMSNLNYQNGKKSRTSSFGNGINFYSHLEGRKSLFSRGANTGDSTNALNNSTLSLTSLNRRQFNASIYGSTSALSDSRLLNTFSPFYKGKTTYGGAAAYKKYSGATGASRICNLTPTIIRPTSSLSTLSSSNNSIAANSGGTNAIGNNGSENTSAISSTAKRILDLINDFATPLSEAKKMANTNVKAHTQLLTQAKSRLNENDLQASRAIRLSQVRTPYARPAVTLQPTIRNSTLLPPVKELQVPSMSQLLQMKKMQSTTERSRQIAMQSSSLTTSAIVGGEEYTLPMANENYIANKDDSETRHQQPHTNKIKSKGRSSARITASKNQATNLEAGESPPPVNLPNITFPLMQSVPKFDIAIPNPRTVAPKAINKPDYSNSEIMSKSKYAGEGMPTISNSNSSNIFANKTSFNFNTDSQKLSTSEPLKNTAGGNSNETNKKSVATDKLNFKFSAPLTFACVNPNASTQQNINLSKNYKFSPPTAVCSRDLDVDGSSPTQRKVQSGNNVTPQLRSGSVLDALKLPLAIPSTPKENATTKKGTEEHAGFGDEFKKASSNKWECQTCLIPNENNVDKCAACEMPRIKSVPTPQTVIPVLATAIASGSSNFGTQFKKSSDQWDCDVCMIRNKQQVDKCVACETPRKGATPSTDLAESNGKSNSFGEAFKPKANTWECPTCLINNKNDCNECVACQTENPKIITKNTPFKFGFSTVDSTALSKPNAPPDIGFKSLAAAQMSAKWECDACMTRNDAARNKCVCCEQAKPGITTPDVPSNGPKFTFGTAASSKFTFGFGSSANGTSSAGSGIVTTSVAPSNQKTEGGNTKGLEFDSSTTVIASSRASDFSFGIKTTPVSVEKEVTSQGSQGKDVADNGNNSIKELSEIKTSAFKFGTPTTSVSKNLVTTKSPVNFKFGVPASVGAATTASTAATVKFSLATADAVVKDGSTKSTEPTKAAPSGSTTTGGFVFGNATSQSSTNSFSFAKPANTTSVETKTTLTTPFSFGVATSTPTPAQSSTTTTSTATVKPLFSFGSNTTSTSAATSTSAPAPTTITSSSVSAFTNCAGGFSFGSSITGNATASQTAKPAFGGSFATVEPSAVASVPGTAIPTLSASSTNVFGTLGVAPSSAKTTTTSAIPILASTAAVAPPASNVNPFGTISHGVSGESKPTASATMIFGNAGSKTPATAQAAPAPFVFGSSASNPTMQGTASTTSASGNKVAPTSSWQKSGFTFGVSNVNATTTSNTTDAPKPVFGSFGSNPEAPTATASSAATVMGAGSTVFGGLSASNTATIPTATFGSVAANTLAASQGTVFGASAATSSSATQSTQNLFGAVPAAPSGFGAPPSFGSASSSAANNTPNFGAASPATFGSFGAAASSTSGDGASAPKKSEPAFNFGGNTSQIASSGGFNFGQQASAIAKPAFNFTASNAPTFNFTGSSSDQAAKPFQFGATPAPLFNFSGGAVEANTISAKRTGCHAGTTKDPATDKTSYTTVEQFIAADASKGVDQQQTKLTGQLQWSRQRNIKDNNNSNIKIPTSAWNDDCHAAKLNYDDSGNSSSNSKAQNELGKSLLNSGTRAASGHKDNRGYNPAIKSQVTPNKYKYIRMPNSTGTQNTYNTAIFARKSNTISEKPKILCKSGSMNEISVHQKSGMRLVKRSIRIRQKFNKGKAECEVPQSSSVEMQALVTPNLYRKVNLKNGKSVAITTQKPRHTTLQLPSQSPSEGISQYRLERSQQDNTELNPLHSHLVESLAKKTEHSIDSRKARYSFVITTANRATIATDDAIDYVPSPTVATRAVSHK
ncbi:PREDICTED: nuclear pore complex protein Nup153-like isoform X4 [Rhagoletis zephyria]|uniref:nuclear pore complex protein Nup153-like isoform X4 n=1 Tax=Rhagoletis zephyria TaxID=28612 RepID=UPI000811873A|nr:PREDICTED: nuclear pore complex protein Nup153-like isoform X4 [Rhagoletis zephyria]